MSMITVRARDSVTALEMVQRRLGDDALILSNLWVDGQVEITASDEMPEHRRKMPERRRGVDIMVEDAPKEIAPRAVLPQTREAFMSERAPTAAKGRADAERAKVTHLPKFLDKTRPLPFAAVLADEMKRRDPAPTPDRGRVLRDALTDAARIVLTGPVGAGKSQVALQLAVMRRDARPGLPVQFVFCGTGSHGDGAFLARKSHLLGMQTVFATPETLPAAQPGQLQIVVISGRAEDAPALARAALEADQAAAALVLPAGLRPERLERLSARWGKVAPGVILMQDGDPLPGEHADARAAGMVPLWDAMPDRLVDGLHAIDAEDTAAPDMGNKTPTPPEVIAASPFVAASAAPAQIVFRRHSHRESPR